MSQKTIIAAALMLGGLASLLHFAYGFSGENPLTGLFAPVNESVWEHQKLMFYPQLLWWCILYFRRRGDINACRFVTAASAALTAAPLITLLGYYGYTGAFGVELPALDIILVFAVYYIVLNAANHILAHGSGGKIAALLSMLTAAAFAVLLTVFTFAPPDIPLFA